MTTMNRAARAAIILIPLAVLVHDAASGRLSTFRKAYDIDDLNNQFRTAVLAERLPEARILLARGGDVNARDEGGNTVLHESLCGGPIALFTGSGGVVDVSTASHKKTLRIVLFLINSGADCGAANKAGLTPLHMTAEWSLRDIAEMLILRGAHVNAANNDGRTSLHFAAERLWTVTAELLIEKGADPNAVDREGKTPLHLASEAWARTKWPESESGEKCLELLVEEGAGVDIEDRSGRMPVDIVITSDYCDYDQIAGLLIGDGKRVKLCTAAALGMTERVRELVAHGADVNQKDWRGMTPLFWCFRCGQTKLAEFFIENGADVNAGTQDGYTPLHLAATRCDVRMIEFIMKNRAAVSARNRCGDTPLHLAAQYGFPAAVDAFVRNGADVNARNNNGLTALHCAVPESDTYYPKRPKNSVACLLLRNGADVNARSNDGSTPLHCAIERGYLDIADCLLASGADIHARDKADLSPLHRAVRHGRRRSITFLIGKGANVNQVTSDGRTPLDMLPTVSWLRSSIADLLRQHGAKSGKELK